MGSEAAGPSTAARRLAVSAVDRTALEEAARAAHPSEGCGVMLGRTAGAVGEVVAVTVSRNLEVERPESRYILDPVHLLEAHGRAEAEGLEVIGIWHSHPNGAAVPSELDRDGAWPGWSYLIVSIGAQGPAELRSWRLEDGRFAEEGIVDLAT